MIKSDRVFVGCAVKEKNIDYANLETEYLFRTLSEFSNLSNAKKITCFTEEPDKSIKTILDEIDVQIKIVTVLDTRQPFANKIRILEEGLKEDVDVIVMLDTDIIVANDFSKFLSTEKILIKPEDRNVFSISDWQLLFDFFQIELPKKRFFPSCDDEKTIPYFNGGVIIIPKIYGKRLLKKWIYYLNELLEKKQNIPSVFSKNLRFFDQIAFTLALSDSNLPYDPLPLSMNYPFSGRVSERENPDDLNPYIIHHHHCILENGHIMHCPYKKINLKIDEINKFLQKSRKIEIDLQSKMSVIAIRNLTMVHNFDEVLKRLSNLSLDDSNADFQYYLALSLHSTQKKLDEALIRYTKALELGFEPFMIFFNRAMLNIELGNLEYAKDDLLKSNKCGSSSSNFYNVLIQTLKDKNDYTNQVIKDKDAHLEQVINDKDTNLEQIINDKDTYLKKVIRGKNDYTNQVIKDKDDIIKHHANAINDYKDQINEIRNSKSWKILHKFDKN